MENNLIQKRMAVKNPGNAVDKILEEVMVLIQEIERVKLCFLRILNNQKRQEELEKQQYYPTTIMQDDHPNNGEVKWLAESTVEINPRLTSFLEYDNSFLSPWSFNPYLTDAERARELLEKKTTQEGRRLDDNDDDIQCMKIMGTNQGFYDDHDDDLQAFLSGVCDQDATLYASDYDYEEFCTDPHYHESTDDHPKKYNQCNTGTGIRSWRIW